MEAKVLSVAGLYNYKERLNMWKQYAIVNKEVSDCKKCMKVHCRKSILLDDGQRVCWFCWIRKDSVHSLVVKKSKPKNVQAKPKLINEVEILEEAFSTVDNIVDDANYETEITKLANAVLVNHSEPQVAASLKPAPIIVKEKIMNKEKTLPAAAKAKSTKTTKAQAVKVEAKPTEKIKAAAPQVEVAPMPEVSYSKFNPYMAQFGIQETKWKKVLWNVVKYGTAASLAIFAILALYFSSLWQTVQRTDGAEGANNAAYNVGFLVQLGILNIKVSAPYDEFMFAFPDGLAAVPGINEALMASLNNVASDFGKLALFQLQSQFSEGALNSLLAFAIISIIAIFPLLVFKNGTVCSASFIGAGLTLLIIIVTLFSIGMSASNAFVAPFRSLANNLGSYGALGGENLVNQMNGNLADIAKALGIPL